MKIYPCIDLKDGRCVRLFKGRFDDVTVYEADPVAVAADYAKAGAVAMHVVDLDGARDGAPKQAALVGRIVGGSRLEVQTGGGIRTVAHAKAILEAGATRVVVGSLAVQNPEAATALITALGPERVTLAVDVLCRDGVDPVAAVHGWQQDSGVSLWALAERYVGLGVKNLLCTDIGRDGTMTGPNTELYSMLQTRYPEIEVQASGGIGSLEDLRKLSAAGVKAAIVGKAIWEKKFTVEEALQC